VARSAGDLKSRLLLTGWDELAEARLEPVAGGLSEASVFHAVSSKEPSFYLKIGRDEAACALGEEITRTRWLAGRGIRVPEIVRIADRAGEVVLLSKALPGAPADASPMPVSALVAALAAAIATIHALPADQCPFDETFGTRLSRAAAAVAAVAADEIDTAEFAARNHGKSADEILGRLRAAPPQEDIVVVHGDATLSNLIVGRDGTVGFIDCGNTGRGDRYVDLAVLSDCILEDFGEDAVRRFEQAYAGRMRGHAWDRAKAAYCLDLYELF
jgi:aminoglycoside phosphotransferase